MNNNKWWFWVGVALIAYPFLAWVWRSARRWAAGDRKQKRVWFVAPRWAWGWFGRDAGERAPWRVWAVFEPRDLWVGVYVARPGTLVYVFPVPVVGIMWERAYRVRCTDGECREPATVRHLVTLRDGSKYCMDWARDPVCAKHGPPGGCKYDTRAEHIPMPPRMWWVWHEAEGI